MAVPDVVRMRRAMRKRVYIESTVPSFYVETRREPEMAARRQWTQEWWDGQRQHYGLVTSIAVIEELADGDYPNKALALDLMADLPLLPNVPAIDSVVDAYVARHVMPADPRGDALHLAMASYHHCHFLLHMELPPSCECQQVRAHPLRQHATGALLSRPDDTGRAPHIRRGLIHVRRPRHRSDPSHAPPHLRTVRAQHESPYGSLPGVGGGIPPSDAA